MIRARARSPQQLVCTLTLVVFAIGCFGGGSGRTMRNGEDLLIAGGAPFVRLLDSIPGDAILTGGDVTFQGTAGGDYLGAGGTQKIGGRVYGSVRSVGGEIHAMGTIGRNATIAGGNVNLDSTGVIGGNAYFTGGSVTIAGAVRGSLLASGGGVMINGPVGRDVEVAAGSLHLGPRAQISGDLRYKVPKDKVRIDAGAKVGGSTTALPIERNPGKGLLWMLGFVVAGIVIVALFPAFAMESAETLYQRPGRSALVGLAWCCLVPIVIIIAAVTIIGLPLALLTVPIWLVVLFLGSLPVSLWIGKKLLGARAQPGRNGAILSVLVGGLVLALIGLIPALGALVGLVAALVGAGAILIRVNAARTRSPEYAT